MKKTIAMLLALLLVAVMLPVTAMAEGETVEIVGGNKYATLADAVNAVTDGTQTEIKLLDNCSGSGIVIPSGRNITIDFGGYTYTVSEAPLAGSTGTQNQCFQLLKGSNITLKNGHIVANDVGVRRMIQNYSNLTLDNMTLDATKGTNSLADHNSLICNDCGDTKIIDTTIVTKTANGIAIDAEYWGRSYPEGGSVTVSGTSNINGKLKYIVDDPNTDEAIAAANGGKLKLTVEGGNVGAIINQNGGGTANIEVSGGTFAEDVTAYTHENLVIKSGSNYYVGNTAKSTIENATSGTFEIVGGMDVDLTVKGGVTIKVTGVGSAVINGKIITNDDGFYTVPGNITIIVPSEGGSTATTPEKNPSTGANDFVGAAVAVAVISALGAAAVVRKK